MPKGCPLPVPLIIASSNWKVLGFITRISDHIVVLNEGRILAEGTPAEVRSNPLVAAAYLGSSA